MLESNRNNHIFDNLCLKVKDPDSAILVLNQVHTFYSSLVRSLVLGEQFVKGIPNSLSSPAHDLLYRIKTEGNIYIHELSKNNICIDSKNVLQELIQNNKLFKNKLQECNISPKSITDFEMLKGGVLLIYDKGNKILSSNVSGQAFSSKNGTQIIVVDSNYKQKTDELNELINHEVQHILFYRLATSKVLQFTPDHFIDKRTAKMGYSLFINESLAKTQNYGNKFPTGYRLRNYISKVPQFDSKLLQTQIDKEMIIKIEDKIEKINDLLGDKDISFKSIAVLPLLISKNFKELDLNYSCIINLLKTFPDKTNLYFSEHEPGWHNWLTIKV